MTARSQLPTRSPAETPASAPARRHAKAPASAPASASGPSSGGAASAGASSRAKLLETLKPFLTLSERFGNMLSRLLLGAMYFLLLGPFALLYRLVADPLHLRRRRRGNWTAWTTHNDSLGTARRQD